MPITLTPEQEDAARTNATALGFKDVESYLAERLLQIHEQDTYLAEQRDAVRAMIDEGWEQLEQGKVLTSEEAHLQRQRFRSDFLMKRSAA